MNNSSNHRISLFQYCVIIFILSGTFFEGLAFDILFNRVGQDAVISSVLGLLMAIPFIILFIYINNYKPELNILQKVDLLYGKVIGNIVNFAVVIIGGIPTSALLVNLSTFLTSKYLPTTPPIIIMVSFMLVAAYDASNGIETIARKAELLFFFMIFILLILFPSTYNLFQFDRLKPFIIHSPKSIFQSSFIFLSCFIIPITSLLIISKNSIINKKKFGKNVFITSILSAILLIIIMSLSLGVNDLPIVKLAQYPIYALMRYVEIGTFFKSMENFLSLYWIISIFSLFCLAVYYYLEYAKKIFNIKKQNTIRIWGFIIAIFFVIQARFLFPDTFDDLRFIENLFPKVTGLPIIIFFIITSLLIFIKKRKNKTA